MREEAFIRRAIRGGLLGAACSVAAMAGPASGQPTVTTPPASVAAADPATIAIRAAIAAEAEATVNAFNGGDAAALGGMFIADGELVDENGSVTESRTEITSLFRRFFERFPKATLEMEVTDARAVGDEMVVEEGIRRITADQAAAAAQVRYVAVRLKEGARWPLASYREFSDDPQPTPTEMLASLEWIVGDWVDESPEGQTQISYGWSEDGNFLIGEYNLSVGGQAASKSVQRIGWDPVEGTLRSWTFDSDGGFSEGEWLGTDDGWVVKSEATLPDGTIGSATVLIGDRGECYLQYQSEAPVGTWETGSAEVSDPIPVETFIALWIPGLDEAPFRIGKRRSLWEGRETQPSGPLAEALESWVRAHPGWRIEGRADCLVLGQPNRLARTSQLPTWIATARSMVEALEAPRG